MADDTRRNPAAWTEDCLAGRLETAVSKKWSGDYNGGIGQPNSGG
jgi:hypothetical protein